MVLNGLDGVEVIAEDILVYGVREDSSDVRINHGSKLVNLMERIRENVLR